MRIFTPVRCLNRDQIKRYHLGQMTDVEQHLVEHHLIECDLCHDALQTLEHPSNLQSYQQLSTQLSQYIQKEYATSAAVPQRPLKAPVAKLQKHTERRSFADSAQSYFWTVVFLAFGGGGIYLLQQHLKNRPPLSTLPLRTADALVLPAPRGAEVGDFQPAVVTQPQATQPEPILIQAKYSTRDTPGNATAALNALPPADTAQKKKPPVKDSAVPKLPPADTNARSAVAQAAPPPAETPKEQQKEQPKEEPKEEKAPEKTRAAADNENEPAPAKSEANKPANGDDYVFRSAMQYQQQGDYNEAINQYRRLSDRGKYAERARYNMAICYRDKGQKGKARRMLKDIANSEGAMKSQAQEALSAMN